MEIRQYRQSDIKALTELFYETVHAVNTKDYTPEQLDAWAPAPADAEKWDKSFREHYTLVATDEGIIVGFGDIDKTGYLDRLYVHADYQRKGIASAICDRLEASVPGNLTVHASVTAKKKKKKRGYRIIKEQSVNRNGVSLTNFIMEKRR